ncbi:MAG: hypothetical protein LLG06_02595 [Desulfobacteraceae bacterium]|nr:hypothetical protein [Desulfobacteraceae bacterium]
MNKMLKSLYFTIALALLVAFASFTPAQAAENGRGLFGWINDDNQLAVDRHLEMYDVGNSNLFGMDRAYNTVFGSDRDADFRAHNFVPEIYGLHGDYQRDQNN